MKRLLALLAAATTRAALVAKDRDHYARYWAREHENGRCDAKHCEWMRGFGSIDVGCRLSRLRSQRGRCAACAPVTT